MKKRKEHDALGYVEVDNESYYGSETQRGLNMFNISGVKVSSELIHTYAVIKKSAAYANMHIGKLDKKRAAAIIKACDSVIKGELDKQFPLDVFQAGAGTSTNMNVNEVITNKAIEILGGRKGNYKIVHPNDHVNMSQSTNDTYPTAVNITCYLLAIKTLLPALKSLEKGLLKKQSEFSGVLKIGRTHLQDAVPIRLGDEFGAYAGAVDKCMGSVSRAAEALLEVPIGGTAVGTGLNAGSSYTQAVKKELARELGFSVKTPKADFTDMSFRLEQLGMANALDECAVALTKTANDLRILASGPRAGISEITLPAVMPGSSIMPGKVNPSMAEMLNMVCLQVMGNAHTIRNAVAGAQLELNVFTPVISYDLIYSIKILSNAVRAFNEHCIRGIKANTSVIKQHLEMDLELATALNQHIGYAKAAKIANIALKEGKSIKQVCIEREVLDRKTLDRLLDPENEFGNV